MVVEAFQFPGSGGGRESGDVIGEMRQGILMPFFRLPIGFDLQLEFVVGEIPELFRREAESADP